MVRAKSRARVQGRREPHLWLLTLSAAGLLISVYLTWARAAKVSVYCLVGSGCDIVQSSRYAAAFGIPVALLGVLFYGALFVLAARPMESERRFALALPFAAAGVGSSAVFTVVQQVSLRATCFLCLVSAALTLAIAVMLLAGRPHRLRWTVWGASAAALLAAVLFLTGGYAASRPISAEQAYAAGLARHLTAEGVKMYGAYWCPACNNQKALFGPAAAMLPYILCDARSPIGQPGGCVAAQIRAFPTWEIKGQRYEGVLSLEQLAEMTGYQSPPPEQR